MSESEQWIERATYDFKTARAMLEAGRHLYVLFCCQHAVEKALKALILKRSGQTPPRLHHLARLAERTGLRLNETRTEHLTRLTSYYITRSLPWGNACSVGCGRRNGRRRDPSSGQGHR